MKDYTWKEIDAMTPEEIGKLVDYNESFVGQTPNFENIQRYNDVVDELKKMMDSCGYAFRVKKYPPDKHKQVLTAQIDLASPFILHKQTMEILNRVIGLADSMSVYQFKGKVVERDLTITRFSFTVHNIWKD